mmetsp:Transcript_178782/g.573000  ORF Transcript_178782/g.573000 Transcript_178782/m.573000 type:complete len:492 (+) Transcript_178782:674-2149(+)
MHEDGLRHQDVRKLGPVAGACVEAQRLNGGDADASVPIDQSAQVRRHAREAVPGIGCQCVMEFAVERLLLLLQSQVGTEGIADVSEDRLAQAQEEGAEEWRLGAHQNVGVRDAWICSSQRLELCCQAVRIRHVWELVQTVRSRCRLHNVLPKQVGQLAVGGASSQAADITIVLCQHRLHSDVPHSGCRDHVDPDALGFHGQRRVQAEGPHAHADRHPNVLDNGLVRWRSNRPHPRGRTPGRVPCPASFRFPPRAVPGVAQRLSHELREVRKGERPGGRIKEQERHHGHANQLQQLLAKLFQPLPVWRPHLRQQPGDTRRLDSRSLDGLDVPRATTAGCEIQSYAQGAGQGIGEARQTDLPGGLKIRHLLANQHQRSRLLYQQLPRLAVELHQLDSTPQCCGYGCRRNQGATSPDARPTPPPNPTLLRETCRAARQPPPTAEKAAACRCRGAITFADGATVGSDVRECRPELSPRTLVGARQEIWRQPLCNK